MICSAVLSQSTRVTDRQTDGRTDGIAVDALYSMMSRVKMRKLCLTRDVKLFARGR